MSATLAINPAIITPIESPSSLGLSPGHGIASAMVSVAASLPNYSRPQTPLSVSGIPATAEPVVVNVPAAPQIILPDINQMEAQLQMNGALLSEITLQPDAVTKPLDHLQPANIQFPNFSLNQASTLSVAPTSNAPIIPVVLASTAPGTVTNANTTQDPSDSGSQLPLNMSKTMTMGVIGLLTLATLAVLGMLMMEEYQISAFLPLLMP